MAADNAGSYVWDVDRRILMNGRLKDVEHIGVFSTKQKAQDAIKEEIEKDKKRWWDAKVADSTDYTDAFFQTVSWQLDPEVEKIYQYSACRHLVK